MKLSGSSIIPNYGYKFEDAGGPPDSVFYSLSDDPLFYQVFVWKNSLYTVETNFAIYRIRDDGKYFFSKIIKNNNIQARELIRRLHYTVASFIGRFLVDEVKIIHCGLVKHDHIKTT